MAGNDDELDELNLYLSESREHLATIESDLLSIEAAGANIDEVLVNKVFRAAHSIKGGAGFFALKKIQELGHKIENVLDMIRSREMLPNPEVINILLLSFDQLRDMVNNHKASNSVDISSFIVSLTGLTTSFLPQNQKNSVQKMVEIKSPSGTVTIEISEFDLAHVKEREEYLYLVEIDLIHDVQRRGKTPWEVFKDYIACGTIIECVFNFEAVGTLDDDSINQVPLDILFASVIDPSFIGSLFEGLPKEKVVLIQEPAHPQPLLHSLSEPAVPVRAAPAPVLASATVPVANPVQPAVPAQPVDPVETAPATVAAQVLAAAQNATAAHNAAEKAAANQAAQAAAAAQARQPEGAQPVEDTLRVNIALLDKLMNLAGELVLSRNQLQEAINRGDQRVLRSSGQRVNLVTSEIQETIMLTRMQPIGNILSKFPRVVRDLARQKSKDIQLDIFGKEVELDKTLIEGLSEPLTHMVRNAVDHGIEDVGERVKAGKNPTGKITLRAYYSAGQVVVEISDDGKGIDPQKVSQAALQKGLVTDEQVRLMSDKEKTMLVFLPGLSTAEKVTDISGRGVGMDVVKTNLDRLGGKVEIDSQLDKGTTFRITLPLTLAIIPSLMVSVEQKRFAIPQVNVNELIRVTADQVKRRIEVVGDAEVLILRGKLIPLVRLSDLLGIERTYIDPQTGERKADHRERISDRRSPQSELFGSTQREEEISREAITPSVEERRESKDRRFHADSDLEIVVMSAGNFEYGLVVERLHDTIEIVVRPLGRHLKECREYNGATILGDGQVALILDASGLAAKAGLISLSGSTRAIEVERTAAADAMEDKHSLLLFRNAPEEQCAIPLEQVLRIEQISQSQVEHFGGKRTMKYRGGSLQLVMLQDAAQVGGLEHDQDWAVIVLNLPGKEVGLLEAMPVEVAEVEAVLDRQTHRQPGIKGSCIIHDRTTLFVDIVELMQSVGIEVDLANTSGGGKATILVAEDSEFFRRQVSKVLTEDGYTVLAASDGQEAWEMLAQQHVDVCIVVTDIEMPRMTGLELTRKIKADPNLRSLPVIALTSLADEADMAAGKAAGVDEYEVKLDRDKLLEQVRQMVSGKE
jgi:two-component system, chemotaxis family, sensor kinase CheA